jgi:hypothetical protein
MISPIISLAADALVFLLRQVPPEKIQSLVTNVFEYAVSAIDKL